MTTAIATTGFNLYPYQQETVDTIASRFLSLDDEYESVERQMVVLPTAAGKTVVFAHLCQQPQIQAWLQSFPADSRKILVIAHRKELLTQAKAKLERYNPHLKVEIEQADNWASLDADVVVASIATLVASKGKRFGRFDRNEFRIVIVDECHHATANSYKSVLRDFGFLPPPEFLPDLPDLKNDVQRQRYRLQAWSQNNTGDCLLLGVTATSKRGDNVGLEAVFDEIVYTKSIIEMMRDGYLSRIKAYKVYSAVDLDWVRTKGDDLDEHQLAVAVDNATRNRAVVNGWQQYGEGRKTVAFCVNVKHAESLAAAYRDQGINAQMISGKSKDRDQLLHDFEFGDLQVLTNCSVLCEGTDIPGISCIVHARPTKSELLFIQQSGRGLRLAPDKLDCIMIDVVDVTSTHSLISAPSLVGLAAKFETNGEDLLDMALKVAAAKAANPGLNTSSITSLTDLAIKVAEVDLFGQFHDDDILALSTMNWRKEADAFRMEFRGPILTESLTIVPTASGWQCQHREGGSMTVLGACLDLKKTFQGAERWLRAQRADVAQLRVRDAAWRLKPVTPEQIKFIRDLKIPVNVDTIPSCGDAANIIDLTLTRQRAR